MDYLENRRWLVIPTSITGSIDFNQVSESNTTTLRLSIDGTKTFVKYDITEVTASYTASFYDIETHQTSSYIVEAGIYGRPVFFQQEYPEYTHKEILDVLNTPEWSAPIEIQ